MNKSIHIFKSFEKQELFFLRYFSRLTPSERLQALTSLQNRNKEKFHLKPQKKITIRKHFAYGH